MNDIMATSDPNCALNFHNGTWQALFWLMDLEAGDFLFLLFFPQMKNSVITDQHPAYVLCKQKL